MGRKSSVSWKVKLSERGVSRGSRVKRKVMLMKLNISGKVDGICDGIIGFVGFLSEGVSYEDGR
jgi:hypothetical protein